MDTPVDVAAILRLPDDDLMRACRRERTRSSGPGGQHRNKVETGIRLTHEQTGVVANATESRSLATNQQRALQRLRIKIASSVRSRFDLQAPNLPPEFPAYRTADRRIAINDRNPHFPIVLAVVLDAHEAAAGSYARTAEALGVTTSQVIKLLRPYFESG